MFANTETKVASLREVAFLQFIFLDLEATFEDFFSLGSTDSNVYSNLLVTADTEGTDSVASLAYTTHSIVSPNYYFTNI